MEAQTKESERAERCLKGIHIVIMTLFTMMTIAAAWDYTIGIITFGAEILLCLVIYLIGVLGVRSIVARFEMSMPNNGATCMHAGNMALFFCLITV